MSATNARVSAGPTIVPTVPPAAIGPYNRDALVGPSRSASKLQNTDTTNSENSAPHT